MPENSAFPAHFMTAKAQLGVSEIVGAKHSPVILSWIKRVGAKVLGLDVRDDETPWCGTFMAWVMSIHGIAPPAVAVRAKSWASWGRQLNNPRVGAILVFTRTGGGHVGMYAGEDDKYYYVLGGNQGNKVSFTWIAKDRLGTGGIRWPLGVALPPYMGPYRVNRKGQPVSTNEA